MKKIISIVMAFVISIISISNGQVFAENNDINLSKKVYHVEDSTIEVLESKDEVTVNVYVNNRLDHTSIVKLKEGIVEEKEQNIVTYQKISDIVQIFEDDNSIQDFRTYSYIPNNYKFIKSNNVHLSKTQSYIGYLYGHNEIKEGPIRHISYSKGAKVGTIVGIIVGLIPGVNAISIITSLGGSIGGAVLGAAIDGKIYAIDEYTYFMVKVQNKVTSKPHRMKRYAKVINNKTGRVEKKFVGDYGNWNDYNTLIYDGVKNYSMGFY